MNTILRLKIGARLAPAFGGVLSLSAALLLVALLQSGSLAQARQHAARFEASAAAAESLKNQAAHLARTVAVFKLDAQTA